MNGKKSCLCCGYLTLESEIFDICPVCCWQDEPQSWDNPDFVGGANGKTSLRKARRNYMQFEACDECFIDSVRKPTDEEIREKERSILEEVKWFSERERKAREGRESRD